MPKYFIKTYGCQMNVADSERLAGVLKDAGFSEAASKNDADIILVNTCVVRKSAEDRATSYISSLKFEKKVNPDLKIAVCGCIVTEPGKNIETDFSHVDLFIAPNQPEKLEEFLGKGLEHGAPALPAGRLNTEHRERGKGSTAWITITHGCDNFCSYCIVPYVRGREKSRSRESILQEIEGLDKNIYKEVILLGQNVNSYGKGTAYGFAELLRDINKLEPPRFIGAGSESNIEWIKFFTSHPRDMSDKIIDTVKELPKVCEFFHLPLQSGDDEILKKMNRGYTSDHFRKLVEKIRKKIPDAVITSDVVVGFPSETEKQFEASCNLIKELELDLLNTFAYSDRLGTAASKMDGKIPKDIKQDRLLKIMKVVSDSAFKANQKLVGKTVDVLVDKAGEGSFLIGRTRGNKTVKFVGDKKLIGQIVPVKISSAKSWVLEG